MTEPTHAEPPETIEASSASMSLEAIPNNGSRNGNQDVAMGGQDDAALKSTMTAAPPAATTNTATNATANTTANGASSPAAATTPARTATPTPRAPSAVPTSSAAMPAEAAENGAPTRVYLNTKVTSHVMEGMKVLVKDKPADPLRVLGEFLLKRSAEFEGAAGAQHNHSNGAE